MPDTALVSWQELLPSALRECAFKAGPELAWPRVQALDVVSLLQAQGRRILGVDIWIPTRPGPTPIAYDWTEAEPNAKGAATFIDTFHWGLAGLDGEKSTPHFNITVD